MHSDEEYCATGKEPCLGEADKAVIRKVRSRSRSRAHPVCLLRDLKKKRADRKEIDEVEAIVSRAYLPPGPLGDEWLNTDELNRVMHVWQPRVGGMTFLGAGPCDFPEAWSKRVAAAPPGTKFGAVVNTDPSFKPGAHWVALVVSVSTKGASKLEYFDATGHAPEPCVWATAMRLFKPTKTEVNDVVHQRLDGQCGTFSLHYLLRRGLGEDGSMRAFNARTHSDLEMRHFRKRLFRPRDMCGKK